MVNNKMDSIINKSDGNNELKIIINNLEKENSFIKKEVDNYKITINILKNIILGDEKDNYGCPIYLFENKDIRKREYNCKYLIDLYEKYKSDYINKVYEIYELYGNDIYIIFFNIDKMVNIRNKEKWKLWILYLKSKIEEKKKINQII